MDSLIFTEVQIVIVLVIVTVVALSVRFIKLPYTVALVLAGLALAVQDLTPIELTSELVLALFLPPLVFEAAFHLQIRSLRSSIGPIVAMAIPGVIISTLIVGGVLHFGGILVLPIALLFGALISATDPVAVVATFRAVGAPKRLTTLMEGESLFNDGTAIVLFHILLAWALGGELSAVEGVIEFFVVSGGGLLVGLVLGYAISLVIARIDDYLIEITLTTILAFGSYLLAEQFHWSGVLAVVAAGLVNGEVGIRGMSPTTRIVLANYWEYLAFLANSLIFILIGMNVEFDLLLRFAWPALLAVVAVLAGRAITTYVVGGLVRIWQPSLELRYLHVMFWGGLRGAVSLALALSLPTSLVERSELLAMTFAVVLFTLMAQATTISSLLRRLGFAGNKSMSVQYEQLQGRLLATRAARRHLDELYHEGGILPLVHEAIDSELAEREETLGKELHGLLADAPDLRQQLMALTRQEVLRAERAALDEMARNELLSVDVLTRLITELDEAIESGNDPRLAAGNEASAQATPAA